MKNGITSDSNSITAAMIIVIKLFSAKYRSNKSAYSDFRKIRKAALPERNPPASINSEYANENFRQPLQLQPQRKNIP